MLFRSNRSGAVILAGINGGIRQGDPGYYAVQEVQRGIDMGNVAKIVVGVLAIGGTFFILLIREFGEFIDKVSPYNWGESEVLKDEYKR